MIDKIFKTVLTLVMIFIVSSQLLFFKREYQISKAPVENFLVNFEPKDLEKSWVDVMHRGDLTLLNFKVKEFTRGSDDLKFIKSVNSEVNSVPYVPDMDNFGKPDYWATPLEFFTRGGDCEDFAITKYSILRDNGFDTNDMRLLLIYVESMRGYHAVLEVKLNGDWLVLDIDNNKIRKHGDNKDYRIIGTLNNNGFVRD